MAWKGSNAVDNIGHNSTPNKENWEENKHLFNSILWQNLSYKRFRHFYLKIRIPDEKSLFATLQLVWLYLDHLSIFLKQEIELSNPAQTGKGIIVVYRYCYRILQVDHWPPKRKGIQLLLWNYFISIILIIYIIKVISIILIILNILIIWLVFFLLLFYFSKLIWWFLLL